MPCPRPRVTRRGLAFVPPTYTDWKRDFIRLFPRELIEKPLEKPLKLFCSLEVVFAELFQKGNGPGQ
jgi:hypothetical protein